MLSEEQYLNQIDETKKLVTYLASDSNYTIRDLENLTGIKRSTIQRRLDNEKVVTMVCRQLNKTLKLPFELNYAWVKSILLKNKEQGNKKGGINSINNNVVIKDELGHFIGCRRK